MKSVKNGLLTSINNLSLEKCCIAVNVIGFLTILLTVLFAQKGITYDEPYHLATVDLLIKKWFSIDFLHGTDVSAPGPLYALIHYFFRPLTNLSTPGIRLVNVLFLFLIILTLRFILNLVGYSKTTSSAFSIMSAPIIWPISGMALTEIPAMFFAYLGLSFLLFVLYSSLQNKISKLFISFFGGVLFSFSILGRQTFLVVLPVIPILLFNRPYFSYAKRNLEYIITFITMSLIAPCIQFSIWGGLVPPAQSSISDGISIIHGVLYLSYSGVMMFIFSPNFFSQRKKVNIIIFIASLVINLALGIVEMTPGMSVAQRILPEGILLLYSRGLSSIILSCGMIFLASIIKNIFNNKDDSFFLFVCIAILFLSLSAVKITHLFSSRYVACAVPFILLASVKYSQWKEDKWRILRYFLGNLLGFLSLVSYFFFR